MGHHGPRYVGHLSLVKFARLKKAIFSENSYHFSITGHLEGVPVLGLDLAALQGQGGVGVVGEGGQGRLAGVQLRLPADLATLEIKIRLWILQPRPAALFSKRTRSISHTYLN